jgi:hypothetical protein
MTESEAKAGKHCDWNYSVDLGLFVALCNFSNKLTKFPNLAPGGKTSCLITLPHPKRTFVEIFKKSKETAF